MNRNLQELLKFIKEHDGIGSKEKLSQAVKDKFNLTVDRKIYYCKDFAVRFSRAKKRAMGNTVLSLSALQKYDDRPVISCAVLPNENYMMLCNTTCLKKISQTSHRLRVDNIRGSFNHSDILKNICNLENEPENFEEIFAIHAGFSFEDNLERLVEATNGIVAHGQKFDCTDEKERILLDAPLRAKKFLTSGFYEKLRQDLSARVEKVKNEIAIAALIENVKIRGNIIEYLITDDGDTTKNLLIDALLNDKPIPSIKVGNDLGDYYFDFIEYETKTDVKTKVLFLTSNPKAYNIDKLLEFLSTEKSVYLLYFVGIDENKKITTHLCPVFSLQLLKATRFSNLWAGRNSRGVTQFDGKEIANVLRDKCSDIDLEEAQKFMKQLIAL